MAEAPLTPPRSEQQLGFADAPTSRSGILDDELSAAMMRARPVIARYFLLRAAISHGSRGHNELPTAEAGAHNSISTVVRMLRDRAMPPERVLICVKELLASLPQQEHDVMESVRQKVILWAIEDYYRAD